jgi:hypothetical protein
MSDRLAELRRQRALVQTHLAWLDAEIAREAGPAPALPPATPATIPAAPPSVSDGALPALSATEEPPRMTPAADTILEEYRVPESALKSDVRKGCFLYFAAALAAVAAGVVVLYLLFRAAR